VQDYGYNEILRSWKEKGNCNDIAAQPKQLVSRFSWRFKLFQRSGISKLKEISHKKKMLEI